MRFGIQIFSDRTFENNYFIINIIINETLIDVLYHIILTLNNTMFRYKISIMFIEISKITNLLQIFNKLIHDTIFTHQINYTYKL